MKDKKIMSKKKRKDADQPRSNSREALFEQGLAVRV